MPDWAQALKDNYHRNPIRWMWVGMTALVLLLVVLIFIPRYNAQKREAAELLTEGFQALGNDNYVVALRSFDRLQSAYPMTDVSEIASLYKGAALFGLERYSEAEKSYRKFVTDNSGSDLATEAMMGVAACQEMLGQSDESLATYKEIQSKYPGSFAAKAVDLQIARLSDLKGDSETASKIYTELAADTNTLWYDMVKGRQKSFHSEEPEAEVGSVISKASKPKTSKPKTSKRTAIAPSPQPSSQPAVTAGAS